MRTPIALGIALLAAMPQSTFISSTSGDAIMSPAVVVSWTASPATPPTKLDLMVLWRGTPGWFLQSSGHGGGARGGGQRVDQRLHYGNVDMTVSFDAATRATRIQG